MGNHRAVFTAILSLAAALLLDCARQPPKPPSRAVDVEAPPLLHLRAAAPAGKIDAAFLAELQGNPEGEFRALMDLSEQVDLVALHRSLTTALLSKKSRRAAVIRALERVADRQQPRLRPEIDDLVSRGLLREVKTIAIVNRLLVEGRGDGILELAARPEVARVWPEWTSEPGAPAGRESAAAEGRITNWAIRATRADRLWHKGLTGDGVVVAVIDTGAYEGHEQLRGKRVEGDRGWFDPRNGSPRPHDSDGHGTAVLSLAVGSNPDGREIGLAPGARWAAAAANWRNYYSRWRMSEAADWVLRFARPDVLINAWSHEEEGCAAFDLPFIDAWKAAEIFVVFPVGNSGPAPGSGEPPGLLGGVFPDGGAVLSVAALTRQDGVDPRSSRGPSPCGNPAFPSLGAPGADLPHAALGSPSAYSTGTGTSLAAAVVGGGAALLLEAVPEATPEELERALLSTARDLVPPGRDDASGAGALDLEAALKRLR